MSDQSERTSPILIAYARSREEGNLLRPYVRPKEILHDNAESMNGARLARTCAGKYLHILVLRRSDLPENIIAEIHAKGSRVITLGELFAERMGREEPPRCTPAQGVPDERVHRQSGAARWVRPGPDALAVHREKIEAGDGCTGVKGPIHPRISEERRIAIRSDVAAGKNITQTAAAHGISRTAVQRILKEVGSLRGA